MKYYNRKKPKNDPHMKRKKRVKILYTTEEFENFVNRTDIEIIHIDVRGVEQSYSFQQGFMGVVFYEELENEHAKSVEESK